MRYLLVNGPNLNTLGTREPHIYGNDTLADVVSRVTQRAGELGVEIEAFQSNHEGAIIDYLQATTGKADGLIINPGGLAHTSIVLRQVLSPGIIRHVHLDRAVHRRHARVPISA